MRLMVLFAWGCASTDDDSSQTNDTDSEGPPLDSDTDAGDTDPGDTDPADTDTDFVPVLVSWHQAAAGVYPGSVGPASNPLCEDVAGSLLLDEDQLTTWGSDYAGGASLEYTIQWNHELAIGAFTGCTTTNHLILFTKVEDVGGGALLVTCSVTTLANSEPFVTTAWGALAVEGKDWTSVSFVTEEKD